MARFVCCSKASLVGGILSILVHWAKRSFLASFTEVVSILLEYIWTTNFSRLPKVVEFSSMLVNGFCDNSAKTAVMAWYAFQVCHAVFFPFPLKAEVVLQPVNAWENGRPLAISLPMLLNTDVRLMLVRAFPFPNLIRISQSSQYFTQSA